MFSSILLIKNILFPDFEFEFLCWRKIRCWSCLVSFKTLVTLTRSGLLIKQRFYLWQYYNRLFSRLRVIWNSNFFRDRFLYKHNIYWCYFFLFSFDFCEAPKDAPSQTENLGQVVFGERIRPSPYKVRILSSIWENRTLTIMTFLSSRYSSTKMRTNVTEFAKSHTTLESLKMLQN